MRPFSPMYVLRHWKVLLSNNFDREMRMRHNARCKSVRLFSETCPAFVSDTLRNAQRQAGIKNSKHADIVLYRRSDMMMMMCISREATATRKVALPPGVSLPVCPTCYYVTFVTVKFAFSGVRLVSAAMYPSTRTSSHGGYGRGSW